MCCHLTGLCTFKNRLKHTQLNVCEKEELPCFLYLIQIFDAMQSNRNVQWQKKNICSYVVFQAVNKHLSISFIKLGTEGVHYVAAAPLGQQQLAIRIGSQGPNSPRSVSQRISLENSQVQETKMRTLKIFSMTKLNKKVAHVNSIMF